MKTKGKSRMTPAVKTARRHALAIIKDVVVRVMFDRFPFYDADGRRINCCRLNCYKSLRDLFIKRAVKAFNVHFGFNHFDFTPVMVIEVHLFAAYVLRRITSLVDEEFENPVTRELILPEVEELLASSSCDEDLRSKIERLLSDDEEICAQ